MMLRKGNAGTRTDESPPEAEAIAGFASDAEPERLSDAALISALSRVQENGAQPGPADPFVGNSPVQPATPTEDGLQRVPETPAAAERGGRLRRPLRGRRH